MPSFSLINASGEVLVDDQDFAACSTRSWRLSKRGFVVSDEGECLHVYLTGEEVFHANGNRLDNRRENLIYPPEPGTEPEWWNRTVALEFDFRESALMRYSGYCSVMYSEGNRYEGMVRNGLPHGFGVYLQKTECYETRGEWETGVLKRGLMSRFVEYKDIILYTVCMLIKDNQIIY